jgi:hypothetical protein
MLNKLGIFSQLAKSARMGDIRADRRTDAGVDGGARADHSSSAGDEWLRRDLPLFSLAFVLLPSRRLRPLVRLVAAGGEPVQAAATAGIDSRIPAVVRDRVRRALR